MEPVSWDQYVIDPTDFDREEPLDGEGSGIIGAISKVHRTSTDMYCIKRHKKRDGDCLIEKPEKFAQMMESLIIMKRHPCVQFFVGLSLCSKCLYLEYLPNGSLEDYFRHGEMSETFKTKVIFGTACGMMHAHAYMLIHGRLNPKNIMFDRQDEVRIVDFVFPGLVCNEEMRIDNKLYYNSPEMLSGHDLDWENIEERQKSDVWAFGMIVYELVTGCNAYDCERKDFKDKILRGERPNTDRLPGILRSICEACWLDNPDDRPCFYHIVDKLRKARSLIPGDSEIDYAEYKDRVFEGTLQCLGAERIFTTSKTLRISLDDSAEGQFNRGMRIECKTIPGSEEDMFQCFINAGEKGHGRAMVHAARCLQHGKGCEKDPERAFDLLMRAVDIYPNAKYEYAFCFLRGTGTKKDLERAKEELEELAGRDDKYPNAQVALAQILYQEWKDKKDKDSLEQALVYLRRACASGNDIALSDYASMVAKGEVDGMDPESAREILADSVKDGHYYPMLTWALIQQQRHLHIGTPQAAARLLEKLSRDTDTSIEGKLRFANVLRDGKGVKKNPIRARRLLEEISEEGPKDDAKEEWLYWKARLALGNMYRNGIGGVRKEDEGERMIEEAQRHLPKRPA